MPEMLLIDFHCVVNYADNYKKRYIVISQLFTVKPRLFYDIK
jgi:hypothetical protein